MPGVATPWPHQPEPEPQLDTTEALYKATRDYHADVQTAHGARPLRFPAGTVHLLPRYVADWINRDSPSALVEITPIEGKITMPEQRPDPPPSWAFARAGFRARSWVFLEGEW
jgi:hypothetical protein